MSIFRVSATSFHPGLPREDVLNKVVIGYAVDVGINRPYGNGAADVYFSPAPTGGSPSSYTVTSSPGNITATGSSSPIRVTGLTGNTFYTFTVVGTRATFTSSPVSDPTKSILVTTVPSNPVVDIVPNDGKPWDNGALVVKLASDSGGKAVQHYTITGTPDPLIDPPLPVITLSKPSPMAAYAFKGNINYTLEATATNANGTSESTTFGTPVSTRTTPQDPELVSLTKVGSTGLTVAFTPNNTGGASITRYIVTYSASDDLPSSSEYAERTITTTSSPASITGLKPGKKYYVKVQAVNTYGKSVYSNTLFKVM